MKAERAAETLPHRGFRVMVRRCDQCLFGRNRIVDEERKADVLAQVAEDESFFECHKATIGGLVGGCCRGFYDVAEIGTVALVRTMGLPIQWIDPDTLSEVPGPLSAHG